MNLIESSRKGADNGHNTITVDDSNGETDEVLFGNERFDVAIEDNCLQIFRVS